MSLYSKMTNGLRLLYDSHFRWLYLASFGKYDAWDDESFVKKAFECHMYKELNLGSPKTLNEKLQWLKLYNRKPEYTMMVDKYAVRKYIADTIGDKYLIPLLGVWDNPDDIDFGVLPNKFVLKCNHNSGLGMCICKDKNKLAISKVKAELRKGLQQDYYLTGREWPYKNVKRRIIAEKYMTDSPDIDEFTDYKFYCFNGYVDCVLTCIERSTGNPKFYFFDKDWNLLRYNKRGKEAPADFTLPKPENIEEMFRIASELSKGIPFLRVDLYNSSGKIYFGELTFFPDSGWDPNRLPEIDLYFGDLVDLERVNSGNK